MSDSENETRRRDAARMSPIPNSFGPRVERIHIRPASYQKPYRMEASAKATEMGMGLLMELHDSSTHFYADPEVPVGKVDIWAPPAYKEMPRYVTTLDSAEDDWETERDRLTREWLESQQSQESAEDMRYRLDAVRELANAYLQSGSSQIGRDFLTLLDTPVAELRDTEDR